MREANKKEIRRLTTIRNVLVVLVGLFAILGLTQGLQITAEHGDALRASTRSQINTSPRSSGGAVSRVPIVVPPHAIADLQNYDWNTPMKVRAARGRYKNRIFTVTGIRWKDDTALEIRTKTSESVDHVIFTLENVQKAMTISHRDGTPAYTRPQLAGCKGKADYYKDGTIIYTGSVQGCKLLGQIGFQFTEYHDYTESDGKKITIPWVFEVRTKS